LTVARFRLDRIAALTGGVVVQGNPEALCGSFGIDSRLVQPGELFFAVVAGRDGHDFVADAAARGACGAVVSRDVPSLPAEFALVKVPDTVAALQALARAALAARPLRIVGITGSIGKTTTKEFAAALLATGYSVLKSEANFNNHLGLALSALKLEEGHEVAVLEMGMNAPGEIRALATVAPPDVAVVTNVAPVHLEFLKTMEAIVEAKAEILAGLKPGGAAVLNGDDPRVRALADRAPGRVILFGFSEGCEVRASKLESLGYNGLRFDLAYAGQIRPVRVPFLAESYITDLLAALGAAAAFGLPWDKVRDRIAGLAPFVKRGRVVRLSQGMILIDDSYNSSPLALEGALRSYGRLPAWRRVAILGDMLELGEGAKAFHEEAGKQAVRSGWDVIVAVGPLAKNFITGARSEGLDPDQTAEFETSAAAADGASGLVRPGDLVLVKGSRGVRMETIVARLQAEFKES
jgi:UDP-N-acetylmuramoyl-tripeptide--D-alanyl-D-alanine ligase